MVSKYTVEKQYESKIIQVKDICHNLKFPDLFIVFFYKSLVLDLEEVQYYLTLYFLYLTFFTMKTDHPKQDTDHLLCLKNF